MGICGMVCATRITRTRAPLLAHAEVHASLMPCRCMQGPCQSAPAHARTRCRNHAEHFRFGGETRPWSSESRSERSEVIRQADKVGHYATKADFCRPRCGFSLSIRPKMWCTLSCKVPPIVVLALGSRVAFYGAVGRFPARLEIRLCPSRVALPEFSIRAGNPS